MRELRTQQGGRPLRTLYAFDPRRSAILLIGGDKRHVQQPAIAKMERRTDMYLSTLRSHIEAMGGQLEVLARFPDGVVKISNFSELGQLR